MNDSKVVLCAWQNQNNRMVFSQSFWAKTATIIIERFAKKEKQTRDSFVWYEIVRNNWKLFQCKCVCVNVCLSRKFNSQLKIRFISFGILLLYGSRLPKTVTTTTKKERSKASIFFPHFENQPNEVLGK